MNESELKSMSEILNSAVSDAEQKLKIVVAPHKSENGLVSDECRSTEEYKTAKLNFDRAFQKMRKFNQSVPKSILRKWSMERRKSQNH